MKAVAIIPARGGSKRIPHKNIRSFLGKPIIAYSIESALRSGLFSEVMVSTDDEAIAAVAKQYGATVPFLRSDETSNDHATTAAAVKEVLEQYQAQGNTFDAFCCIYATAPLVSATRLQEAAALLAAGSCDAVIPVTAFSYPILRSLRIDNNNKLAFNWPEHINTRSQDLAAAYHDSGQFYFLHTKTFLEQGKLFAANTAPLVVPETEVQDIDNETDWALAELKYKLLNNL